MNYQNIALLILRLTVGSTFMMHGSQKVFGAFGGSGLAGFAGYGATLGVPVWLSHLAAIFEFVGGVMMFFGLATELGACMGVCVMLGAIYLVHGSKGYFAQTGGYEYALNLMLLCVAIAVGGPGDYAMWDVFKNWKI